MSFCDHCQGPLRHDLPEAEPDPAPVGRSVGADDREPLERSVSPSGRTPSPPGRDQLHGQATVTRAASDRWGRALADWAIPEQILAVAPEPPWVLPPEFFTVEHRTPSDQSPSVQLARAGLGAGGTLLDVGCGGGAASVPLAPLASRITGADERRAILSTFALRCSRAGVHHAEVDGRWPDIADGVDPADVVVCHHVVYNVADIAPF